MAADLESLLSAIIGPTRTQQLIKTLVVPGSLAVPADVASRALIAQALNMLLFEDLVARVPAAQLYVERCLANGDTIFHDHGAVRCVDMDGMGKLPRGERAITRILEPLGYVLKGTYPLDRLKMTGRSYAQAEYPEEVAQFFVSELHTDRFPAEFQDAVKRVTKDSVDPVTPDAKALLDKLAAEGSVTFDEAVGLLPTLLSCFDRQHPIPALADYEILLPQSAEMAWISTEGTAFNHATDRVEDVEQLTVTQKALGQPMKDKVEVSGTGRVRQTAFTAARVMREFRAADGSIVRKEVPGSFLEFIARDFIPGEAVKTLDLSFDPSNAQAIFKMTAQQ
jgi:hypothetical protein